MFKKWIACITSFALISCQTTSHQGLVAKSDYRQSRTYLQDGAPRKALAAHPQKDSEYFIPTIEQAWLGILSGKVDTDKLVRLSQRIEDKKIIRFENEMRRFFLKELDEYYLPGEHEIILFHILTGLALNE